jgi:membrane protease YdiL (CAAX protease family)
MEDRDVIYGPGGELLTPGLHGPGPESPAGPQPLADGNKVPWSARDVFAIVGLVILVYIIMAVLLGTLLSLSSVISSDFRQKLIESPLTNTFLWAFQWVLTLGVTFTYLKIRGYQLSLPVLGYRRTAIGQAVILVVGIVFGSFIIQGIYVTYVLEPQQQEVTGIFGSSLASFFLAILVVAILTPIVEETFFRGIIHQGLEQRFGFLPGALMSSTIFMLAHIDPTVYFPIFVLGFGFAALMSQTKSIWPSIAAHCLWNTIGVVAQFLVAGR